MFYNGTSSVLNNLLWAHHFLLCTVWYTPWSMVRGTYMAGQDIGYSLLIPFCGFNVKNPRTEE